ncbi:MAG: proliferating cell nuclear antigen (pcna) [Nitrososphaerales archaeon]
MQTENLEAKSSKSVFLAKSSSPNEWRTIASAIQMLVDDATFEVSSDGISFRGMDSSHVALIDIFWPSAAFEKFECSKVDKFTVRSEDFAKLIKRSESKDSFEISRVGSESLMLKIGNDLYKREFELHLLESSSKASPLPKLSFESKFVMSHSAFSQALNDVSTVSNHVTIRASKEKIVFSGKGDVGRALATFEKGGSGVYEIETKQGTHDDSSSTYNIDYLLKITKSIGPSSSDTIKFEYSSKMPLRMEFGLGESASKGGRVHFYLAPRVGTSAE